MPMLLQATSFSFLLGLVTKVANSTPYNPEPEAFSFLQMLVEAAAMKISQTIVQFLVPKRGRRQQLLTSIRHRFEDHILQDLGWNTFMPPFSRGHIRQYALANYLYNTVVNADADTDVPFPESSSSSSIMVPASEVRVLES
jgi:hypothetical protein